ncbi:MAG: hypothetical protein HY600_05050, partial [Candidatus Omnitrophica bacterium]|nr:hypothetical protein [Candidatus Omnitrophota bacterium]
MTPPDYPPWHARAALVAAATLALALPAPTVPGGPGPPGTGLGAVPSAGPADQLRAGQAARTRVGRQELPRALGQRPAPLRAAGLEEARWRETLERLPLVGERFRELPRGVPIQIPLSAFKALPEGLLHVHLADADHFLLVRSMPTGLTVAAKGLFAMSRTLELGKPLLVGRTPADPADVAGDQRLVLPDHGPWEAVSGTHVRIELTGGAGQDPILALTQLSMTNGTYLPNEQVKALLRDSTAGLEEGTGEDLKFVVIAPMNLTEIERSLAAGVGSIIQEWGDWANTHRQGATVSFWKPQDAAGPLDVAIFCVDLTRLDSDAIGARLAETLRDKRQPWRAESTRIGVVALHDSEARVEADVAARLAASQNAGTIHGHLVMPLDAGAASSKQRIGTLVSVLGTLALDWRRGGLPEGRIFNPKRHEFTLLAASLAFPTSVPEWVALLLLVADQPFAQHPGGGPSAYLMLQRLGEPVPESAPSNAPEARRYLWQLEEAVRRRVLGMDAAALEAIKTTLATRALHHHEGSKPSALTRAALSAVNELSQLQTRAKIRLFFRLVRDNQQGLWQVMRPDGRGRLRALVQDTSLGYEFSVFFAQDDGRSRMVVAASVVSGLTSSWEQAVIQQMTCQLAVRMKDGSTKISNPGALNRLPGNAGNAMALDLEPFGFSNLEDVQEALNRGAISLRITGPGLL